MVGERRSSMKGGNMMIPVVITLLRAFLCLMYNVYR